MGGGPEGRRLPGAADTRLLAAVADQVAQAVEQDRLSREARDAEVARESDRVKTALLETVSHDLRTPLASIRAAAGTLLDRHIELQPEERYATAETIDRDAERLNRIVTNLLDLSRVEAGALHADLDGYDLARPRRDRPRAGPAAPRRSRGDHESRRCAAGAGRPRLPRPDPRQPAGERRAACRARRPGARSAWTPRATASSG